MKHIMAAISKSFTVVSGIAFVPIIFKDIDINDKFVVVEYKNKTRDYISLEPDIKKNSDGGFFLSVKLDSDKKELTL